MLQLQPQSLYQVLIHCSERISTHTQREREERKGGKEIRKEGGRERGREKKREGRREGRNEEGSIYI